MSHATKFDVPGYSVVSVIHNGDWSGLVDVVWVESTDEPKGGYTNVWERGGRVKIPGHLLLALGAKVAYEHLRAEMIAVLEQLKNPTATADQILKKLHDLGGK
jgi:hypothetical protein